MFLQENNNMNDRKAEISDDSTDESETASEVVTGHSVNKANHATDGGNETDADSAGTGWIAHVRKIGQYAGMAGVVVLFVNSFFFDVIVYLSFGIPELRSWADSAIPYFVLAMAGLFVVVLMALIISSYR